MLRLAADENLKGALVRGLLRRNPTLDIVRAQDAGLQGADDEQILAWTAREGRVLLTHDIKTVPPAAYARLARGQVMSGVIAIPSTAPLGPIIDDLIILVGATEQSEWEGKVEYLPL